MNKLTDHVTAIFLLSGLFSPDAGPFYPHSMTFNELLGVSCHTSMIKFRAIHHLVTFLLPFIYVFWTFVPHRPYMMLTSLYHTSFKHRIPPG